MALDLLNNPAFFDIFGLVVFLIILLIAAWSIKQNRPLKNWMNIFLLVISVLGIVVDGWIVLKSFILVG